MKDNTFYSSKDFSKINLKNLADNTNESTQIVLRTAACSKDDPSKEFECASEKEINEYFNQRAIAFFEIKNFINNKKVDEHPIQRMSDWSFSQFFD